MSARTGLPIWTPNQTRVLRPDQGTNRLGSPIFQQSTDFRFPLRQSWGHKGIAPGLHEPRPGHYASSTAIGGLPALTTDSFTSTSVIFSGETGTNPLLPDTWSWDGSNWSQASPSNNPPGRFEAEMAYHAGTRLLVLFGGAPYSGSDFADTWTY